VLPQAHRQVAITAESAGWVSDILSRDIGQAIMLLGAGRERVDSLIDPAVGAQFMKKVGDRVETGEPLAVLHVNDESRLREATSLMNQAVKITETPGVKPLGVILDRIV